MGRKMNVGVLLLIGGLIVLVSGCVSNKRHTRELGALQSQVNSISSEVARIDGQMQTSGQPTAEPMRASMEAPSARPVQTQDFASSAVYRTPSGFEISATDLQRALRGAGYFDGEIDGKVEPKSREAIRAFQKDHGLTPDGVCGRKTWDALKTYLSSGSPIK